MKPPRIDEVTALEPGVLEIRWTTGETLVAHVGDWIERFELLAPLRDAVTFSQVRVGWYGHLVEWPVDIDLGADQLYERCKEEAGLPTPQLFDDWMKRNQLSLNTAAESLGLNGSKRCASSDGIRSVVQQAPQSSAAVMVAPLCPINSARSHRELTPAATEAVAAANVAAHRSH